MGNSLPTSANGSIAPLAPDPSCSLRTMRALADEQFDVLHIHEPFAPGPTLTALSMRPAPILATFHAAGESASYRYLGGAIRRLSRNITKGVAVSPHAALLASSVLEFECELVFNGVDLNEARVGESFPTTGPTIFFCGRHEERKGLDVLLAAMVELPAEVRLWIASTGPDTERLRAAYATDSRIEWLGRISDEEKNARLRGATVFCAPSLRGESFGVVLIEAMAAGTTVVASALDGYRNVATDGVDSLLVPPGDVAALVDALRVALSDEQRTTALRAAGERRAEDFSMDTLADRYHQMYLALASEPMAVGAKVPLMTRVTRMMRR